MIQLARLSIVASVLLLGSALPAHAQAPDLTISTNAASSYTTGATPQINVTVTRTGGNLTLGTYVEARLYRSTDTVFSAGTDTLLWNSNNSTPDYPNSTLNSNGSITRTATTSALPAGSYYILAVVDPTRFHTNETPTSNNVQAYAVTVSSPPDLTISTNAASTYATGATPQINVTVSRTGSNLTLGTYVEARLYRSTDTVFSAGTDTLLWNSNNSTPDYPNSTLNSNGSITRTATTSALPAGTYYILAVVDPTRFHTNETPTSNNVQAYAVTVSSPPDLTISTNAATSYAVGATPQINVTVNRTGGSLTLGTYVEARLYLSTNTTFDGGDTLLWNSNNATPDYPNSTLNSSGSVTRTATTTALSTAGSFYILAVVDPARFHTEETNTSNNVQAYAVTITAAQPDLTNSAVVQPTYAVGATPQINVTVSRSGGALTLGTYVEAHLYLSTDTVFSAGIDTLLWNSNNATPDYPNSTLNSSGSVTRAATATALNTAGSFFVLAVVDPARFHTEETNTSNNVQAYAVTITAAPPDLTVSTSYVPGTTFIAGEPLSMQVTVTRSGGALGGSYVQARIFLSSDTVYQPGTDSQLWQSNDATPDFSVPDLNLNGSRTRTATILVPNQSGSFFLLTVVDRPDLTPPNSNGYHGESNENNNVEAKSFAVDRGLWGRVTTGSGAPVTNVTVGLQPVGGSPIRQSVTDSAGVYRLGSAGLATQDYEIVPTSAGDSFAPSFHRINGVSASAVYPNFDFSASGPNTTTTRTISGTVYALGGAPLSGATVKAFLTASTPDSQATTLANGTYTLSMSVFANSYSVRVESTGRFFLARQANATQGNVTSLDFYEQSPSAPVVTFDAATAQLFQQATHPANQGRPISVEVFTQGSGAPTVTLEYRAINTATWTSVSMTNTGVVWSYALPPGLFVTPGVEVRVGAAHNAQTTTTLVHQLRVGNNPPSQVTIVGVSATDPPILKATGQAHTFEAFVAEPDGDAVTVTVTYMKLGAGSWSTSTMTATGVPGRYIGTIPGTAIQSAVPTFYYVRAVDAFGASAETPRLQINRMPPRQGEPGQAQVVADPINAASGNYLYKQTVLSLLAHGRSFSLTLHYNSLEPGAEPLGYGWTHDYDTVVQPLDDGSVFVRYAHGGADTFVPGASPNTWVCQNRAIRDRITKDVNNLYTIAETGGGRRTSFTSFGRVSRIDWPDGVAQVCTWDATTRRLLSVQIQPAGVQLTFTYDSSGWISSVADGTGRQIGLVHDTAGNLVELVDVGTERTRFEFDANHRVSQIVLPAGNKLLSNIYDAQGRVIEQRDGNNARWQLAYDTPSAGTTTVTDPDNRTRRVQHGGREEWLDLVREDGRQVQVQYGSNGLPSSLTTPDQQTFSMLYDAQGNLQSTTAPGNHTESMTWDANNRLASLTEPGNFTTSLARDSSGRVTQLADQQGSVNFTFNGLNLTNVNDRLNGNTPISYDTMGNVTGFTDPAGVPVTITRNARGNMIERSDPTRATTTQVDAHGRPTRIVDPIAGEFAFGYDLNGNLTVFTTPLGTTRYIYDANDQLAEVIDPANNRTVYTRDARAMIVRVRDALNNEWVLTRDDMGQLTKVTSPEGREVTYTYDWAGRLLTRSDGAGTTTFIRDGRGLVTEVVDPMTNRWRFTRDGRGLVTKVVDPFNRETNYEYDSARRLIAVVDSQTRRTAYTHDAHTLRVAGRPSGSGNVQYGYDAAGRSLIMTDGMGRNWTNTLTNGRLSSVQRPDGTLLNLTYDASGRLQSMSANGGDQRSFTYGAAGLMATASTPAGTTSVLRNHRGQITRRTDEHGYVVEATYDAVGRLASLTYDVLSVTYTHDRDGLLLRLTDSSGRVVDYGHDTAGRLVRATYPNGVVTTITRDAAGRMTGLQHEKSGVVLAAWTITLNALGNRSRVVCTAGAVTWNLPSGSRDFTVSPTGQVQTQGGSACAHDAQGCLTSWPSSSGVRTLTHTGYGRLATMIGAGFSTSYRYDADGEMIAIVLNSVERRFIQDLTGPMSRILAEKNASDGTLAQYVHGLGLAYRLEAGTNAVRFYHSDPNGNVVLLTDENGAPTDRYAYTPFGETVGVVGSSTNPFRFGGSLGVLDVGDGTQVMRRRVYSPELGRFLSPDPIEQPTSEPQGRNVYAYALNNPWGYVDPTGLAPLPDSVVHVVDIVSGGAISEVMEAPGNDTLDAIYVGAKFVQGIAKAGLHALSLVPGGIGRGAEISLATIGATEQAGKALNGEVTYGQAATNVTLNYAYGKLTGPLLEDLPAEAASRAVFKPMELLVGNAINAATGQGFSDRWGPLNYPVSERAARGEFAGSFSGTGMASQVATPGTTMPGLPRK